MAVERLVPEGEAWKELIGEHKSRYLFAGRYAQGRRVLDAGCGVGYGTRMLVEAGAAEVVGVDISDEALATARKKFSHECITFAQDDCETLTRVSGPFDIAVAFESLEHIADASSFVRRISELLAPQGIFVVSTPNKLLSAHSNGGPLNPFHVREFSPDEFQDLLSPRFSNVLMMGQRWTAALSSLYCISYPSWSNPMMRIGRWLQRRRGRNTDFPFNLTTVPLTEADFVISDTDPATAPTLVAVCRGPRKDNGA